MSHKYTNFGVICDEPRSGCLVYYMLYNAANPKFQGLRTLEEAMAALDPDGDTPNVATADGVWFESFNDVLAFIRQNPQGPLQDCGQGGMF